VAKQDGGGQLSDKERGMIMRSKVFAALVLPLALLSCSDARKPNGLWSSELSTITFNKDGTAIIDVQGQAMQVTWRMLDDGRFLITVDGGLSMYGCKIKSRLRIRSVVGQIVEFAPGPSTGGRAPLGTATAVSGKDCQP
jgi:hypothetical protein